mgnify:CR=1 FL=1
MEKTDKSEQAAAYMRQGWNCSQSVVLAFAEEAGLTREAALRAAAGFGGGVGRTGNLCGAVSGAVMVIGLRHGAVSPEDKAAKEQTYRLVQEFMRRFQERFGALDCPALLGYDLRDPAEAQKARDAGLFYDRCPLFVQGAVAILTEMANNQA